MGYRDEIELPIEEQRNMTIRVAIVLIFVGMSLAVIGIVMGIYMWLDYSEQYRILEQTIAADPKSSKMNQVPNLTFAKHHTQLSIVFLIGFNIIGTVFSIAGIVLSIQAWRLNNLASKARLEETNEASESAS